jgi:dihydroflavonol-4-reductase
MNGPAFITGATGFVGGAVLKHLAAAGREVRALARDRTGGDQVAAAGAVPVIGHLFEPEVLRQGMAGCDTVFHVAGVNEMCASDPTNMMRVNVDGVREVMRAAAATGVRRVVFTSSAATLGERKGTIGNEDTPHSGTYLSHYAKSKHLGELAAFEEGERSGVEVVSVNPSSVQGPGRSRGSAQLLIRALATRFPVLPMTAVSIVDIDDCAFGHLLAEREGVAGRRYVLNGASVTTREAVVLLREVTGAGINPVMLPSVLVWTFGMPAAWFAGRGEDTIICPQSLRTVLHGHRYDGSRATQELGLEYTSLSETLRRTIQWLVDFRFVRRNLPRIRPA